MKLTRFADIPQFTRDSNWQVDYGLKLAVIQIQQWQTEGGNTANLDMDPDFQRAHVWTEQQQIAWLEFFLRGGKTGRDIRFNHPGWMRSYQGEFVIMDGKQRMEAARRFIENEIQAFGSYFSEFTDSLYCTDATLCFHVNTLQTRAEVIQWYLEFNTGGTPHTPEEIEKAKKFLEAETK